MEISKASPISVALQSINKEFQKIAENAAEVAGFASEANTPSGAGLAEPLIEIKESEISIKAQVKVINALEKLEDEVLNIIA